MAVFRAVMRFLSYLFHGVFTLFLLAMSSLALVSGQMLHLDMLPWSGSTLTYAIFLGGLLGILCVLLALKGSLRPRPAANARPAPRASKIEPTHATPEHAARPTLLLTSDTNKR